MRTRSHEEWLAELNDVVRRYCYSGQNDPKSRPNTWLTWEGAIARLEDLGFTRGEAMYMLQRELRKAGRDVIRHAPIPATQPTPSMPTSKRPAISD
jgi:hypothetical protein